MFPPVSSADSHSPGVTTKAQDTPEKIRDAAHQFEALLIGQMMKSVTESEGGWMGTDDDDASSTAMEYAQEMFAQAMAAGGGFGLADLVAKGLTPKSNSSTGPQP